MECKATEWVVKYTVGVYNLNSSPSELWTVQIENVNLLSLNFGCISFHINIFQAISAEFKANECVFKCTIGVYIIQIVAQVSYRQGAASDA
jgi:hypothetical protein